MIFAILFFIAFVVGVIAYVLSDRWWLGGAVMVLLLLMLSVSGLEQPSWRGMVLYFGIPIVFLGSLFGAYIVQLRRTPLVDQESDGAQDDLPGENLSKTETKMEKE